MPYASPEAVAKPAADPEIDVDEISEALYGSFSWGLAVT